MEQTLKWASDQALQWTNQYGYHAVVPALLLDPGGVPWPWIFLMLLAGEAGKSVPLMLAYGFVLMTVLDHALYFVGVRVRGSARRTFEKRRPSLACVMTKAENTIRTRGFWAIAMGRFVPVVGRWVGVGAGMADVAWSQFAVFDAIGVAITVLGFGLAANWVGRKTIDAPWFHEAVGGTFLVGIALSIIALVFAVWKAKKNKQNEVETVGAATDSNGE